MASGTSMPQLDKRVGLDVLTWPVFRGLPINAVVTTRDGGVSTGPYSSLNLGLHVGDDPASVVANRRRAAAAVGLELADLVFCAQPHGRAVAVVDRSHRGRGSQSVDDALAGVDALVTTSPGVGLVVMVADCVPLVLYEPVAHVVGCVHAGWRGTVGRVVEVAVEAMVALGARPDRILAGIGPAIPADRYQVGPEVADAARACFPDDVGEVVQTDPTGRWRLDLEAANRRVLLDAGLTDENISRAGIGTGPGTPFFSHRAAQPCGRFGVIASLSPGPSR